MGLSWDVVSWSEPVKMMFDSFINVFLIGFEWDFMNIEFQVLSINNILKLSDDWSELERIPLIFFEMGS
jgi:hypothetical protein